MLWGTLMSFDGSASLAAISGDARDRPHLRGVGDVVDGATIVAIEHGRVWVRREDRLEQLPAAGAPAHVSPLSAPGPAPSRLPVQAMADGSFAVDRAALRRDLPGVLDLLVAGTHVIPAFRDGALQGFKVLMKKGSPLESFGLQSGDILTAVNGERLTPQLVASLAARWLELPGAEVQVQRGGQSRTVVLRAR